MSHPQHFSLIWKPNCSLTYYLNRYKKRNTGNKHRNKLIKCLILWYCVNVIFRIFFYNLDKDKNCRQPTGYFFLLRSSDRPSPPWQDASLGQRETLVTKEEEAEVQGLLTDGEDSPEDALPLTRLAPTAPQQAPAEEAKAAAHEKRFGLMMPYVKLYR